MDRNTRIAVVGGGLAGLTVGGLLKRAGYRVAVYEQAWTWTRIGAGIILGANVAKVLRVLGLETRFATTGIKPDAFVSRAWDTGETIYEFPFNAENEQRFGGPFVNIHRADLHALLIDGLGEDSLLMGHALAGIEATSGGLRLDFTNGATAHADIVIAADGIDSRVRAAIRGEEPASYTGRLALRAVLGSEAFAGIPIRDCTKWWGPDRHVITYFMTPRRDELYVMGAVPSEDWSGDPSPAAGDPNAFATAFGHFHPDLSRIARRCTAVTVSPICDRPRDDRWYEDSIVQMGDACHPVRPYMAAGGSMAIEDAAILSRCIARFNDPVTAFSRYAAVRIPRVAEIQRISIENSWMRQPHDVSWFYGYDAMTVDLGRAPPALMEARPQS